MSNKSVNVLALFSVSLRSLRLLLNSLSSSIAEKTSKPLFSRQDIRRRRFVSLILDLKMIIKQSISLLSGAIAIPMVGGEAPPRSAIFEKFDQPQRFLMHGGAARFPGVPLLLRLVFSSLRLLFSPTSNSIFADAGCVMTAQVQALTLFFRALSAMTAMRTCTHVTLATLRQKEITAITRLTPFIRSAAIVLGPPIVGGDNTIMCRP